MKRLTTLLLFFTMYSFGSFQTASAIFCANCAQVALQIPQLTNETLTSGADLLTQINTFLVQNKTLILDPIQNAMIAMSLLSQQKSTLNLVLGGLGGQPLLKSNPTQWIQNQGLNAVKISLSDISGAKGVYSNSLFSSIVGSYKNSNNLTVQLQGFSNSSIPAITQNNLCKDANLTAVAKNDVMASNSSYTAADIARRKTEIYNSLCVGNPTTDQNLAGKLLQVNSQRPDIGGWDTWLATINGDNAYTKSVQAQIAVAKDKETKEEAAKDDLNRGGGVASPSNCTETDSGDTSEAGLTTIANLPCRTRELTGSSAAVSSQLQQALNSKMQKTISAEGWGILGPIGSLLSGGLNLFQLGSSITSATGGSSGGGNNASQTTGSNTAVTQDLEGNASAKSTISDPINKRLNSYASSTEKLAEADSNLGAEINIAKSNLDQIRACYQSLVDDFKLDSNDQRVAAGLSYYQQKNAALDVLRENISRDQSALQASRDAVSDLRNLLTSSNSTQEINNAYTAFDEKISNGTILSETAFVQRDADYQKLSAQNQIANLAEGELSNLRNNCQNIRQQLTPFGGY